MSINQSLKMTNNSRQQKLYVLTKMNIKLKELHKTLQILEVKLFIFYNIYMDVH